LPKKTPTDPIDDYLPTPKKSAIDFSEGQVLPTDPVETRHSYSDEVVFVEQFHHQIDVDQLRPDQVLDIMYNRKTKKPSTLKSLPSKDSPLENIDMLLEQVFFEFDESTSRFTFWAPDDLLEYLQMPKKLKHVLGFQDVEKILPNTTAKYTPDITAGIHKLMVYDTTGMVEKTIVGDKMVPLLRMVNVNAKPGENVEVNYDPPMYVRVLKNDIGEGGIEVRDQIGEIVDFNNGLFSVTGHFKPVY